MTTPDVSIIVPVHNAGAFLPALLDSLKAQHLAPVEFLLVNDASSDGSDALLAAFAAAEPRAILLHQPQVSGSANARNAALAIARGRYIAFADADDIVAPDQYLKLLAKAEAESLDVAYCNADCFSRQPGDGNNKVCSQSKPAGVVSGHEWLVHAWRTGERISAAWLSLVRRDLIESQQLRFPAGVIMDDELWTPLVLLAASRVAWLDESLYFYRGHPGSITQTREPAKVRQRIDSFAGVAKALFELADQQPQADLQQALRWLGYVNGDAALGLLKRLPMNEGHVAAFRNLQETGLIHELWRQQPSFRLGKRWAKEWLLAVGSYAA